MKIKSYRTANDNSEKKNRESNIELFRIVTMILIIAHHYVVNSGLMAPDGPLINNPSSIKTLFLLVFGAWGKTGINCFVLITGYFMSKSNITIKKYIKILFDIIFYKVLFYVLFLITGYIAFNKADFLKTILPITGVTNSFTDCYLLFYLFIPFFNILIKNMNEKLHFYLVSLLVFVYTILGTLPKIDVTMNYITWFTVIYFIGAYIRIYPKKHYNNKKFWMLAMLITLFISMISIILGFTYGPKFSNSDIFGLAYYFLADSNKFLALFLSVCSFMFFKNLKISYNKTINLFASSTFAVLMIHANSDTMRHWLWVETFKNVTSYNSPYIVIHAVCCTLCVFLIASIIDIICSKTIKIVFFKIWDKNYYKLNSFISKVDNYICKIFNVS